MHLSTYLYKNKHKRLLRLVIYRALGMGRNVRMVVECVCMQVVGNFSECNFLQSSGLQNHVNDSYA